MQEHITKNSPILGKDAVYTKTVSFNKILLCNISIPLTLNCLYSSQKSKDCQHI